MLFVFAHACHAADEGPLTSPRVRHTSAWERGLGTARSRVASATITAKNPKSLVIGSILDLWIHPMNLLTPLVSGCLFQAATSAFRIVPCTCRVRFS